MSAAPIVQDLSNAFNQIQANAPIGQTFTAEGALIDIVRLSLDELNAGFGTTGATYSLYQGVGTGVTSGLAAVAPGRHVDCIRGLPVDQRDVRVRFRERHAR